jgi:hypothetical protein
MKKITTQLLALGASIALSSAPSAQADEIQFTTLPQPVQTTVIHETQIADPSYVTRVVRSDGDTYAVTVRRESGEQVVYVNAEGAIVQAPASTTTTTTVQQPAQEEVVTYEQVQKELPRYELIKKEGRKEVYRDRQTGQKVKVEREKD